MPWHNGQQEQKRNEVEGSSKWQCLLGVIRTLGERRSRCQQLRPMKSILLENHHPNHSTAFQPVTRSHPHRQWNLRFLHLQQQSPRDRVAEGSLVASRDATTLPSHVVLIVSNIAAIGFVSVTVVPSVPRAPQDSASLMEEVDDAPSPVATRAPGINFSVPPTVEANAAPTRAVPSRPWVDRTYAPAMVAVGDAPSRVVTSPPSHPPNFASSMAAGRNAHTVAVPKSPVERLCTAPRMGEEFAASWRAAIASPLESYNCAVLMEVGPKCPNADVSSLLAVDLLHVKILATTTS